MEYLAAFSVDCPDGYQTVPKPATWQISNGAYGKQPLVFCIKMPLDLKDYQSLVELYTQRLYEHFNVISACTNQLARNPRNHFIIGIDKYGVEQLIDSYKKFKSDYKGSGTVDVSSDHVWMFQVGPKTILG